MPDHLCTDDGRVEYRPLGEESAAGSLELPAPLSGTHAGLLRARNSHIKAVIFRITPALPLNTQRAALIRQDLGRPCVLPDRSKFERNHTIMSQAFAVSLTDAERDQVEGMAASMYRTAMEVLRAANETAAGILQDANNLRAAAGLLPVPAQASAPVFHLADYRRAVQR